MNESIDQTIKFTPTGSNSTMRSTCPTAMINAISTVCLVLAAGMLLAGCGKSSKTAQATQEDAKPINTEAPPDEQEQARIAQAAAIRDGIKPPEPDLKLRGGELATPEVLKAYNVYLLRYIAENREAPESMQELMRIRTLPRLPTPPPGKRIVYDPINRIIKLDPP